LIKSARRNKLQRADAVGDDDAVVIVQHSVVVDVSVVVRLSIVICIQISISVVIHIDIQHSVVVDIPVVVRFSIVVGIVIAAWAGAVAGLGDARAAGETFISKGDAVCPADLVAVVGLAIANEQAVVVLVVAVVVFGNDGYGQQEKQRKTKELMHGC